MIDHVSSCLLLVEDDPNDVVFFRRGLEKPGVGPHLRPARDGEEAMAYLEGAGAFPDRVRHPFPALMGLDLQLPKISGLEILKWIRHDARFKDLPVVIFTSSNQPSDVGTARELGILAYPVKPVGFKEFTELAGSIGSLWFSLTSREPLPAARA